MIEDKNSRWDKHVLGVVHNTPSAFTDEQVRIGAGVGVNTHSYNDVPPHEPKEDVDEGAVLPPMPHDQSMLQHVLTNVFGNTVWDDGVENTAARVLRFWREYANRGEDVDFKMTTFEAHGNQLVICKDIEFSSLCAHHLLPFYGRAHVGYVPNKLQVGLSKIPRLVDFWANRPQVQEKLTDQIASSLKDTLEAMGVAVVVEARHTCMACRGVRKHNGVMTTSNMRGVFLTAEAARLEFLTLIGRSGV